MGDTPGDVANFKAQQREQWSNVAPGWRQQWGVFEQGARPLSERMMELAHVAPGQRVLDVATGIGEPAMTAARLVGSSGKVVAVDQASQMLVMARERMLEAGIRTVEFIEGDAETIPLPLDSFDAVVSRWGIMFFHDPVSALARFRSSLVGGGWLTAAIWGPPERVPLISLPFSVLSRSMRQPPSLPSGSNPFALSVPTTLEQVLRDAGFVHVQSEPFPVTFVFGSMDDFRAHLQEISPPIRMVMATTSLEDQAVFWRQLADAAIPFTDATGRIRLTNECLIATGRR